LCFNNVLDDYCLLLTTPVAKSLILAFYAYLYLHFTRFCSWKFRLHGSFDPHKNNNSQAYIQSVRFFTLTDTRDDYTPSAGGLSGQLDREARTLAEYRFYLNRALVQANNLLCPVQAQT